MEDELNYTEVSFKNRDQHPKAQKEDLTIYSEVKIKAPASEENTAAPVQKEEQTIHSEVKIKAPASEERTPTPDVKGAMNIQNFYLLAAVVATLCIILLVTVSLLIYFVVMMNNERVNVSNLSVENQRLIAEKSILENKTEDLIIEKSILENKTEELIIEKSILENKTEELIIEKSILENKTEEVIRMRDSLNWTMGVIMKFNNFPVNDFCPQKRCQPCQNGWIQFQEKCYFFYNEGSWKTWHQSQTYCKNQVSDLVIIETLQEQEFISKNIHYYFDIHHGFWIGLRKVADNNWFWVDGREDTLEYWINGPLHSSSQYALMIPGKPLNASWAKIHSSMLNKFICEHKVLMKSF